MNLGLISLFLVVGLFQSSSALTPEECQPLVTPRSLADPSVMFGKTNFLAGYTDNKVYKHILNLTDSSWISLTASSYGPNELVMSQENKLNGMCFSSTFNMSIDGSTVKTSYASLTSAFHLLPSCDDCLVFRINSTSRDSDKTLKLLNFNTTEKEIRAHSVYLFATHTEVKDSDLQHFKQQASCLGFSGEPDYLYDPKKELCREGEGIPINIS